ncbi:MAG TPA: cyanophycinase [Gemmatimonadales bacterium]|nr:cyanophycinase [Gemmatimonadales bacterium]
MTDVAAADVRDTLGTGFVIPVGGAEEKVGDITILRRFVKLCGGTGARIAIIPTASELNDTGDRYSALFETLGAASTVVLPITDRSHAMDPNHVRQLEDVGGIFLTGGNQLRLSTLIGGTDVSRAIRRLNAAGVHVAGTSAGAAFLCEHMIAIGREGASPRARIVTLAPGLGLTNRVIIDQHFRQRDRLGRLLTAISYNPFAIGIGLDENTAAFIGPDNELEVVGGGALTVVDPSEIKFSSMARVRKNDPVCLIGLRLHILDHGSTYNLHTREAAAAPAIAKRV